VPVGYHGSFFTTKQPMLANSSKQEQNNMHKPTTHEKKTTQ
jgi:hypothetical protein